MISLARLRQATLAAVILGGAALGASGAMAEGGNSLASRMETTAVRKPAPQRVALRQPVRQAVPVAAPAMRWGRKGSDAWTRELMAAIEVDGHGLVGTVPQDVNAYCPGYAFASTDQRMAFWAGLVSSIAKHESTWNPRAKGGGGKWLGLMQIAPATWRAHGCDGQILDGGDNLACAVRIMAKQVGRDGVIAGGGARGVGRDWAPMRSAGKRADIAGWTRQQAYCSL